MTSAGFEAQWKTGSWDSTSTEKHPWLQRFKEEIDDGEGAQVRWFVPRGQHRWPLLKLVVWSNFPAALGGVMISAAFKENAEDYFTNCPLPIALVPQLIEMLSHVQLSLKPEELKWPAHRPPSPIRIWTCSCGKHEAWPGPYSDNFEMAGSLYGPDGGESYESHTPAKCQIVAISWTRTIYLIEPKP